MVSNQPPEEAINDIPVTTVCRLAFNTVFTGLPALIQMALFPFLLSALLAVTSLIVSDSVTIGFILGLLSYVPHTLFAVAWHRRTLLNRYQQESTSLANWERDHWHFLMMTIILLILFNGLVFLGVMPVAIISAVFPPLFLLVSLEF